MAKKYIDLTASQKDEIRRLTQLANRRIKNAEKAYRKEGRTVLPSEVVGGYQVKEKWNTKATPISRSVKFQTQKEYRQQLKFLRSFEVTRPGIKEYTQIQREKTKDALDTSFGDMVSDSLMKKIDSMSAPQLSDFWKRFSDKSAKLAFQYSSSAAMAETLQEFFPEDMSGLQTAISKRPAR